MSNGKGDLSRPLSISVLDFGKNWENTFKKPAVEEDEEDTTPTPKQFCPPLRAQRVVPTNRDVHDLHTR